MKGSTANRLLWGEAMLAKMRCDMPLSIAGSIMVASVNAAYVSVCLDTALFRTKNSSNSNRIVLPVSTGGNAVTRISASDESPALL